MSTRSDDALLDALAVALAPAPVAPSAEELRLLRAQLERSDDRVVPLIAPARSSHPLRQAVTIAAAVVAVVVIAGAIALRAASSPSHRVRAPVGAASPVASSGVDRARAAMAELREALDRGDDVRVAHARAALDARLAALDAADRTTVDAEASVLLARADARLGPPEIGDPAQLTRPAPEPTIVAPAGSSPSVEPGATSSAGDAPPGVIPPTPGPAPTPTTTTSVPDGHESEPGDR